MRLLLRYLTAYDSVVSEILAGTTILAGYEGQNCARARQQESASARSSGRWEGNRATHLEVGVDAREPPGLAPRAHAHARKLLLDVVHLPPVCALLALALALALARPPRLRERVPALEPARGEGAALRLEAVPREVGVGDRGEGELVDEVVARAEDEGRRLAGEGGRGAGDRVQEGERDLQGGET